MDSKILVCLFFFVSSSLIFVFAQSNISADTQNSTINNSIYEVQVNASNSVGNHTVNEIQNNDQLNKTVVPQTSNTRSYVIIGAILLVIIMAIHYFVSKN